MKTIKTFILLLLLTGCIKGVYTPVIEQRITESHIEKQIRLETEIWYKGKRVWFRQDASYDIDSLLIIKRYDEAKRLSMIIETLHH